MKNICMPFKGPSQLLEIVLDLGAYLYCKISGKAPFLSYYSKKKKKKKKTGGERVHLTFLLLPHPETGFCP